MYNATEYLVLILCIMGTAVNKYSKYTVMSFVYMG
jgi:hypothetical protein